MYKKFDQALKNVSDSRLRTGMYFSKISITIERFLQSFLILMSLAILIPETMALSYEVTPEYLTQKAELVILGSVKSSLFEERPYIHGTTNGETVTYRTVEQVLSLYEVEIEKSFKQNSSSPTVLILVPGGILPDGRGWIHSQYFELDVGEKFVAFLVYDHRNKAWDVYAGSQGIYRIKDDHSDPDNPLVVSAYTGHVVPRGVPSNPERERQVQLRVQDLLIIIRNSLEK